MSLLGREAPSGDVTTWAELGCKAMCYRWVSVLFLLS